MFVELCRILRGDLTRQATRLRKPVSVEKRVAVGVWRLSTENSQVMWIAVWPGKIYS